ncbi:hypothetical protein BAE44_0009723, partial [Dichanthelium oligosanthes]
LVIEGVFNPETAEAMACREGLSLASDLMLQKIRVASDSANVIRSLHRTRMGHYVLGHYGHIVKEIRARKANFKELYLFMNGEAQI